MKRSIFLYISIFIFSIVSYSQSKKELEVELKIVKNRFDSLQSLFYQQQSTYQQKITYLESVIDKAKFVLGNSIESNNNLTNLKTTTSSDLGNNKIQSVDPKTNNPIKLSEGDGLTPKTGGTIYTGPRGGQYYINKNGNKTYIRRKNS
jgi:colicin import membrane protein